MATRLEYRTMLQAKIVGLEDEGYGDFEFEDAELNIYLDLAVTRLYPAVYTKKVDGPLTVTTYGTQSLGEVSTAYADQAFLIEEASERTVVAGWQFRPGKLININTVLLGSTSVNVYYHDAYTLPTNDTQQATIPARFTNLIVLGALIEALESRHDTGVRGEPPPTGPHQEVPLIDRLVNRYESLKQDLAMALPGVQL